CVTSRKSIPIRTRRDKSGILPERLPLRRMQALLRALRPGPVPTVRPWPVPPPTPVRLPFLVPSNSFPPPSMLRLSVPVGRTRGKLLTLVYPVEDPSSHICFSKCNTGRLSSSRGTYH